MAYSFVVIAKEDISIKDLMAAEERFGSSFEIFFDEREPRVLYLSFPMWLVNDDFRSLLIEFFSDLFSKQNLEVIDLYDSSKCINQKKLPNFIRSKI
ncbi:hypothetical protein [Pontibacter sp. G13]|uniref:hypothetical protein n=1 Tax=Pontibacter sp. G13 TaxID=3074898 RepID=UPI00288B64AC|nr:hypothetical protein [Pontibacter sp. G13]WNJ17190.1 hypothetical protein RJD25_20230 [Pontibacter sp. G13]